jgi:SCP-2 sterol transfer family
MAPDASVLCRLYLEAVLPCLTDLAAQDPDSRAIIGNARGRIALRILGGPGAVVTFDQGRIAWSNSSRSWASVTLLFFSRAHLNAFFGGAAWALPLPIWGGWRIGLLARFAKLAERLEAVLDGHTEVLASAQGRRLHARLSLIAAGLGLAPLAAGDAEAIGLLQGLPAGLAAFRIEGEPNSTVWFDSAAGRRLSGWSDPPRRPDVCIVFGSVSLAYAAMRDEADTMAAIGSGELKIDGLIPLADGLNVIMERLRIYLQP